MSKKIILMSLLLAFILGISPNNAKSLNCNLYKISVPSETIINNLKGGGRVSDYSIFIYGASIRGVLRIKKGWHIAVQNELPQLKGFAPQGAGDITDGEIRDGAFTEFLLIETTSEDGDFQIKICFSVSFPTKDNDELFTVDTKDVVKEWAGCPDSSSLPSR